MQSTNSQDKSTRKYNFGPGNKYGKGGKRIGAGRKSKKEKQLEQQREQTALEIYKAEQQKQARQVVSTYYKLAKSGKHAHVTVHEIDKISPDEINIAAPTTINFIQYNINAKPDDETSTITVDNANLIK